MFRETSSVAEIILTRLQAKGAHLRADEIRKVHETAKLTRAESLAKALPPSLIPPKEDEGIHTPLSPSYSGPFVPIPYSDPNQAEWADWYRPKEDYVDGRSSVIWAREDKEGKVRPGGWDLGLFWEMEIRAAVEGLGIKPISS